MPTNLYGPGDDYSAPSSHVLPTLIRRRDDARIQGHPEVTNWGSGTPRREFLRVEDQAITEIAEIVAAATGFTGSARWGSSKPDGAPRKLLGISTLRDSGWQPTISLRDGIEDTVAWFRSNQSALRV